MRVVGRKDLLTDWEFPYGPGSEERVTKAIRDLTYMLMKEEVTADQIIISVMAVNDIEQEVSDEVHKVVFEEE